MPRLTYCPSTSSFATRAASCSLLSTVAPLHGPPLDALLDARGVHDALHEDARCVHEHRVEVARLDELLDRGDRDPAGGRAQRVEVLRRLLVDEVAVPVAVLRVHEPEVAHDRLLEHVVATVEGAHFLRLAGDRDRAVSVVAQR